MFGMPGFDPEALMNTATAAQSVNVPRHTVKNWRTKGWIGLDGERKKLLVVDYDADGRPLHRYGDVVNAERETFAAKGKCHRRTGAPQQLDALTGTLRPVNWNCLDRQNA